MNPQATIFILSISSFTEKARGACYHYRGLPSRIFCIQNSLLFFLFFIHHLLPCGQTLLSHPSSTQDAHAVSGDVSQQPSVTLLPLPVQTTAPTEPSDPCA